MNYIIGIAGAKNSGKDTIANIISYIDNVGLSKATYRGWLAKYLELNLITFINEITKIYYIIIYYLIVLSNKYLKMVRK